LAVSVAITVFVLAPELYILSVTSVRALFVWLTWYGDVFVWATEFLTYAPWVPVPAVIFLVFILLRRLLVELVRRWRPPLREGGRPWWVRGVQVLLGVPLLASGLALAALLVLPALSHGGGYYTTGGGGLQRDKCSRCHSPYRPFHFIKTEELWKITVNRMRRLEGAPIDDGEQARITDYLVAKAALKDDWIFRAKCLRCHGRGEITRSGRTAEEWELIIGRVARTSPYAFRADWRNQLERYAARELSIPSPEAGSKEADELRDKITFERVCGSCHELASSLGLEPGRREAVVRRMLGKVPTAADEAEREALMRFLKRTPISAKEERELFPHDMRVWPLW